MMNDQTLAQMTARLQAPLLVREMLETPDAMAVDIDYNLHDIISDMQPDAAILTTALSLRLICQTLPKDGFTPTLDVACTRIIEEYGPVWLAHSCDMKIDNAYLIELLSDLPEDFESLNEFMDVALSYMEEDSMEARILEVLRVQCGAHSLIAEAYLDLLNMRVEENAQNMDAGIAMIQQNSNVIAFPGAHH